MAIAASRGVPLKRYLEDAVVKPKTLRKYKKELSAFLKRCDRPLVIDTVVDEELVGRIQHLFEKGHQPSRGEVLLASVLHFWPEFGRLGTRTIPRSWRALRGWRRLCPARSRSPHALAIWSGISVEFLRMRLLSFAIYLMMMVASYTRPSELLSAQRRDLQKPVANVSSHWQLLLFPEERPERSKVYAANDSIELSVKWAPWLPTICEALSRGNPEELIFQFTYADFMKSFSEALRNLGLPKIVPYQARHSGPSIDAAMGLRNRSEIKARGRWSADKSVLRYEQRARLTQSFNKLPVALQSYLTECEEKLGDLLCGKLSVETVTPLSRRKAPTSATSLVARVA